MVPVSVQGLAAARGQRSSLKPGSRTRVPSGSQSPATPSAEIARTLSGPKAEEPKRASGSTAAHRGLCVLEHQAAVGQRQHSVEAAVCRRHLDLLVAGEVLRHIGLEKEDQPPLRPAGRPELPRCTGEGAAEFSSCVPLLSSVTCGRGGSTVTGTFNRVRPAAAHWQIILAGIELRRRTAGGQGELVEVLHAGQLGRASR